MEKIDDGGAAFPQIIGADPLMTFQDGELRLVGSGMSLRDWFAGKALEGILSDPKARDIAGAETAYRLADAMLKARKT